MIVCIVVYDHIGRGNIHFSWFEGFIITLLSVTI